MRPPLALLLAALALAPGPAATAADPAVRERVDAPPGGPPVHLGPALPLATPGETGEALLGQGLAAYTAARRAQERGGGLPAGVRVSGLALPLPLAPLDPFAAMRARLAAAGPVGPVAWAAAERHPGAGSDRLARDAIALALAEIEARMGRAEFDRALDLLAQRPRHGPAGTDDLLRALGSVTGEDLSGLWQELAGGAALVDVGVVVAASQPDPTRPGVELGRATIVHRGGPRLPLTIELRFADGTRRHVRWDGRDDWLRIHSEGPRLVAVRLEPSRSSPLAASRLDDARLVDPDPRPRRRALQRLRFLAQLFLEALADLA